MLLAAIFAAGSCLAADEAFQISLEIFDENRETTVCTYHSRAGTSKVTEHEGRYFCPRVITEAADPDEPAAHLYGESTLVARGQ